MSYLDDPVPILNGLYATARDYQQQYRHNGNGLTHTPRSHFTTPQDARELLRLFEFVKWCSRAIRTAKHVGNVYRRKRDGAVAELRRLRAYRRELHHSSVLDEHDMEKLEWILETTP